LKVGNHAEEWKTGHWRIESGQWRISERLKKTIGFRKGKISEKWNAGGMTNEDVARCRMAV